MMMVMEMMMMVWMMVTNYYLVAQYGGVDGGAYGGETPDCFFRHKIVNLLTFKRYLHSLFVEKFCLFS